MNNHSQLMELQPGYEIHWYRIESVLGQGAFGITYLAHDVNLDRQVAIKEYLPGQFSARNSDLSVRPITDGHKDDFDWGLKRFISEAKILTKFEHSNLVRVFNVFEMNGTAYMVMNYEVGKSLQQILKKKKTLSEDEIMKILCPLLNGLELMHGKGFVHRDIKPGNIFIRNDGSPVLLDFGSARQTRAERGSEAVAVDEQQTVTALVSPGYAPIEQYGSNSNRQGAWTDIYGLGATLYKSITGKMPQAAVDRSETIIHDKKDCYLPVSTLVKNNYTEKFLAAVDHALAFKADNRPQSIADWRIEFGVKENVNPVQGLPEEQDILDETATFKLEQSTEAVTINVADNTNKESIYAAEEETENIELLRKTGNTQPVSFRSRWLFGTTVVTVLFVFAIFKFSGEKKNMVRNNDVPPPVVQTLPKSEQPMVEEIPEIEEIPSLSLEVQARIEELLMLAQEDIAALRLTSPNEKNALNKYLSILILDENNTDAIKGIESISDNYISLAYSAMEHNDLEKADEYIEKANIIYASSNKVIPARIALQEKYTKQETRRVQQGATESSIENDQKEEGLEAVWESIKKWNEKNQKVERDESELDSRIRKQF